MALLNEDVLKQVRKTFEGLENPVKMLFFTRSGDAECEYCEDTLQLYTELAALTDKLSLETHDLDQQPDLASRYGVNKAPAMIPLLKSGELDGPGQDFRIRYFGIPAGYEFASLLESLLMVSRGKAELASHTRQSIKQLDRPVRIQVYVTPT